MRKQQVILLLSGSILLVLLFFFGKTTAPLTTSSTAGTNTGKSAMSSTADILSAAKKNITQLQSSKLTQLENSVVRGNVKEQKLTVYRQLAQYWNDSLHQPEIAAFYLGEEAKLENSEKKLNFAARLLLQHLMAENDPDHQSWLSTNAKALFEQSLRINPTNDSVKVDLGSCYIFGNISNTPMEGILKIKEVAERDSSNMYAQLMLGLGDIRSGQYDKAIERLHIVLRNEPGNLQAILNLAETYERKGDKANAVDWYRKAQTIINIPEAKEEIEKRIKSLQ